MCCRSAGNDKFDKLDETTPVLQTDTATTFHGLPVESSIRERKKSRRRTRTHLAGRRGVK